METVVRGSLKAKAGTGKAVKIDGEWYELSEAVMPFAAKIQKPYPEVEVKVLQKGYKKIVTFLKVVTAGDTSPTETFTTGSTTTPEYIPAAKEVGAKSVVEFNKTKKQENEYWNAKDKAIKKGNALNAAGAALAGSFSEATPIEVISEKMKILAQDLYEWLEMDN